MPDWEKSTLFRAFRHRNFRLFYMGQIVSLSGLWMQRVAMNWLVYRITGSPLLLGTVDFMTQIPVLLFGSFTGAFLEGRNLRRIIMICQTISMLHALTLAVLTLSGVVEYWHILILAAVIGISDSFEVPARQGFTIRLVEDERTWATASPSHPPSSTSQGLWDPPSRAWSSPWWGRGYASL